MNETYIILLSLVLIYIVICKHCNNKQENWEIYKQLPYDYIKTGSTPMNYYTHNKFRKPYRYPFTFMKSYPVNHLSHLD